MTEITIGIFLKWLMVTVGLGYGASELIALRRSVKREGWRRRQLRFLHIVPIVALALFLTAVEVRGRVAREMYEDVLPLFVGVFVACKLLDLLVGRLQRGSVPRSLRLAIFASFAWPIAFLGWVLAFEPHEYSYYGGIDFEESLAPLLVPLLAGWLVFGLYQWIVGSSGTNRDKETGSSIASPEER